VRSGGSRAQPSPFESPWTVRGLIASHKPAALITATLLVVMVALIVVADLGAKTEPVTDATTCTQWGAANVLQQHAYGQLYVREHGAVPRWGSSPTMVINAINAGCFQAYGEDVDDNTTVVQAISGKF
jgi:hypothetical protein